MMIVNNKFPSVTTVDNTGGMTTVCLIGWQQLWSDTEVKQKAIFTICTYFVFELRILYLPSGGGSEHGNRLSDANFLTVFHSNWVHLA